MLARIADQPFAWTPILWIWAAAALLMAVLWGVACRQKSANWVDFGWALGLFGAVLFLASTGSGAASQRVLLAATAGIWSGRLAWHLLVDRTLGEPEDGRYRHMRQSLGSHPDLHFLWFFQAQALLVALLALPFQLIASNPLSGITAVQWVGVGLFVSAKLGEAVADRQLARWRRDPANRGRTCRQGLWRYSRHPNYFCEWLIWVAFALLATPAPHGGWAWLAPAAMYLFVTRLTGIPWTEQQSLRSRGDDYRAYQRTTSAFFPMPPRDDPGPGAAVRRPAGSAS